MLSKHLEVTKIHEVVTTAAVIPGEHTGNEGDGDGPFGDSNPRTVMRIYRIRAKKK